MTYDEFWNVCDDSEYHTLYVVISEDSDSMVDRMVTGVVYRHRDPQDDHLFFDMEFDSISGKPYKHTHRLTLDYGWVVDVV